MNSSRYYLRQFVQEAAIATPARALVLDAGAGDCCYRTFFSHAQYESADFAQVNDKLYGELTYTCDLTDIPVADGRYRTILCTQVLAHLPAPQLALQELYRILEPGGQLFLTAPLFFHENEQPHDYHRFTQYGLRNVIEQAGFSVECIQWLEGYCGTLAYQLGMAARQLPITRHAYGGGLTGVMGVAISALTRPLFAALSLCYSRLDRANRCTDAGMCKNYAVIANR